MSQWDAVGEAAAAARRVNRALAGRRVDDAQLVEIARSLNDAADVLEAGEPRVKLDDMLTRPHLAEIYAGRYAPMPVADGEELEFDPFSIGGGHLHPASVGVTFRRESDTAVTATCTLDPMFAGPPERAHGGMIAAVFDEVMGALIRMRGRQAFTAGLTVDYRAPTPLGEPLRFRAWVVATERRKVTLRGTADGPDGLCAEAESLYIEREDQPTP
ncbi:MAG TPA: hypothetical protein DEP66_00290 [Acidimicrobiaceae bacterium]|nr:hypothetical protein [Acidimicrobiaceae bacterium]HCB36685.1 hypothetical protein [Acidimicrobiaceae bacterium]